MEQRAESVENETTILEEKEQLIMSVFDILLDLIKIFPSTGKWLIMATRDHTPVFSVETYIWLPRHRTYRQ